MSSKEDNVHHFKRHVIMDVLKSVLCLIMLKNTCCGMGFLSIVSMCCSHWLRNTAALTYGKTGQQQEENPRRDTVEEEQSLGDTNQLPRKQNM